MPKQKIVKAKEVAIEPVGKPTKTLQVQVALPTEEKLTPPWEGLRCHVCGDPVAHGQSAVCTRHIRSN